MNIQSLWVCCAVLAGSVAFTEGAPSPAVYDFDRLKPGSLIRPAQDGWTLEKPTPGFTPTPQEILVVEEPGGTNRFLVGTSQDGAGLFRQNDAAFSFPALAPTSTVFASTMDILVRISPGGYGTCMALAGDGRSDDDLVASARNEVGPWFGLVRDDFKGYGMAFSLRAACMGDAHLVPIGDLAADGDWMRLLLVVDIPADTGSLFYRNLSRRMEDFAPVAKLQDVPMNLGAMDAGVTPYSWNALYLRIHSHTPDAAHRSNGVDRLVPFAPVPARPPPTHLSGWIEKLRNGDAAGRSAARKALRELPPEQRSGLNRWKNDPDPEVSETVRELLNR